MQTKLGHLVFGIAAANRGFYRDLFGFLGWRVIYDAEEMLAVVDRSGVRLWFDDATRQVAHDYDGPGMNHLATASRLPSS
jgi:hypothetical protein